MVKQRILVADDEEIMRSLLSDVLRDRGYDVETVADGEAAVNKARGEDFDLVILDVIMPGMNGIEALKNIREFDSELPAVILTSDPTEETKSLAEALEISGFISKDEDIRNSVKKLELILELHSQIGDWTITVKRKN